VPKLGTLLTLFFELKYFADALNLGPAPRAQDRLPAVFTELPRRGLLGKWASGDTAARKLASMKWADAVYHITNNFCADLLSYCNIALHKP
jgi:hypothetical protein